MSFTAFLQAVLQVALYKKESLEDVAGGKQVSDPEAVNMILRQIRSGWKNWEARNIIRAKNQATTASYEDKLCNLGTHTVSPLSPGHGRISVISPKKDKKQR